MTTYSLFVDGYEKTLRNGYEKTLHM